MNINEVDIFGCMDCWISHKCHGYSTPPGITEDILMEVIQETEWQFGSLFNYPNRLAYSKAGIGTFMEEYLEAITNSMNEPNNTLSFILYSAHDTTIMAVLNALNIWDGVWPSFASSMITEYYGPPNPSIRILYNYEPVPLPDCARLEFCPIKAFQDIVKRAIPEVADDCKSTKTQHSTPFTQFT